MADATPSRPGQVNLSGADDALFLKVFGGEVLTAFEESNVFLDKHFVRTIDSGKSAQFPVLGRAAKAKLHVPGTELTGQQIAAAEQVITVDGLLIADTYVALIDELKNHYDVRSKYATELGRSLAKTFDEHVAAMGLLAARAANPITGMPGGTVDNAAGNSGINTDSDKLVAAFYRAATKFDETEVPDADTRYGFIKPAQYYLLAQNTKVLNKDWGGSGVYSDGKVYKVAGITLVKTNHLPSSNITSTTEENAKYRGDFSKTVALIMTNDAVGTVKLLDLAMESGWDRRRQATHLLSKYVMGHGIVRSEAAYEVALPAS